MIWIVWSILLALTLAMILTGVWSPTRRLQFPCLAGFAILFMVVFPIGALAQSCEDMPKGSLLQFAVMAVLCLLCSWTGYHYVHAPPRIAKWSFDMRRLTISVFVLVFFGSVFQCLVHTTPVQIDPVTHNWTGPITIYLFFAQTLRFAFVLGLLLLIRTRNWALLIVVLPQLFVYVSQFEHARRSGIGECAVIVVVLLYFWRRYIPPFWLMASGAVLCALLYFNVGELRATIGQPIGQRLRQFKEATSFSSITVRGMAKARGSYVEVYNGAHFIAAKTATGNYTLGRHFWNQVVFGWVPGQLVGRDVKQSLKIPLPDDTHIVDYKKANGTCETGIAEAYMSFWYFGAFLFFLLGAFMRKIWEGAVSGSMLCQCLLCLFTLPAVMTFSIQLWTFINSLLYFFVFVWPLLVWARVDAGCLHDRATTAASQLIQRSRLGA